MEEDIGLTEEQKAIFVKNLVGKVREYFYEPVSRGDIRLVIDEELKRLDSSEDTEG